MRELTRAEIKQFRLLYPRRRDAELAAHFGITVADVEHLAAQWAMGKCKLTFKGVKMKSWTDEEIARLRALYPTTDNIQLGRMMGRSARSVLAKATRLGISKSDEHRSDMGRKNSRLRGGG